MASKAAIFTLAALMAIGGALAWFMARQPRSNSPVTLTPEAKVYVRNLQLSEVSMKATESYVKQMVTEIEGKIANNGSRAVRQADVYCIFYNSYGEVVLRERVPIVASVLKPGDSRPFRLAFDTIPASWNNQMPQLVIARIEFA